MKRFLPHLIIFAVVAGAHVAGLLTAPRFALTDIAFRLTPKPANEQIVVVEIDAHSLRRLNVWPS
jgi:CHASE2 domain-containing sensor protein